MSRKDLTHSHVVPWKLVAMRLNPPRAVIAEFTKTLRASTGLDPDDPANHPVLLTQHRRKISAAMAAAATAVGFAGYGQSLTNWSCISLFGSSSAPAAQHAAPVSTAGDFAMDCDHGGLHTGDLPLHIPDVWQAFERMRNVHVSARLCALTAPHHGSTNGHNALLYTKGSSPLAAIFTTGLSSKSTPGKIIYSHRNVPEQAMKDAALTATVIALNNPLTLGR